MFLYIVVKVSDEKTGKVSTVVNPGQVDVCLRVYQLLVSVYQGRMTKPCFQRKFDI